MQALSFTELHRGAIVEKWPKLKHYARRKGTQRSNIQRPTSKSPKKLQDPNSSKLGKLEFGAWIFSGANKPALQPLLGIETSGVNGFENAVLALFVTLCAAIGC